MLPNFFVIGAGKSGTTSIHYYLGLHPEVYVPDTKEPNFFCRAEDGPWPFGRVASLEEYEALFESDARRRGDCSTNYSHHPLRPGVPERIRELVPEANFIYLVRDPVARVLAHYLHGVSSPVWNERRSLREVVSSPSDPRENPYLVPSLYATQLERYREVFPAHRIVVIDSVDLRESRSATLRRVFRFLGVDETFSSPGFSSELNPGEAKRVHSSRYARLRRSRLADLWRRLPTRARRPFSLRAMRALTTPAESPALDDDVRVVLDDVFRPEVERLRVLTGESFSTWSI